MIKKTIISVMLMMSLITAWGATLESGKVYRFENVGKPGNYLALSGANQGAVGAASNTADLKQQWYVTEENGGFYFRNVSNGGYLTSPKALYVQWPVTFTTAPDASTMLMALGDVDGNMSIRALSHTSSSYAYAHNDGSNNIVCWLSSSTPTQWQAHEVEMTSQEIEAMLRRFSATGDEIAKASEYEKSLDALFTDKSYSELKSGINLSTNSEFAKLPILLQNMALKVESGNWSEADGDWDSPHARKYRVQSYEPYSEGSAAAGMAGIQAYTNMNNPTGIIANSGEILYVMVKDEIKDGATLYIGGAPDCGMYNSTTSGTKLKQGLNMILCNSDLTHYFIYYTVNTVKDRAPYLKVTDYDPITIHIEGGRVNGFFDYVGDSLYTPDTKEDFEYTTQRARHPMYDLIGKYVILHFYLEDTPDLPGGIPQICVKNAFSAKNTAKKHDDPVITMTAWDNMCFAERILMGLQKKEDATDDMKRDMMSRYESIVNDGYSKGEYIGYPSFEYSDYFNNKMMGINYQASGLYMNATSWRTAYAASTISAILSQFPEDGIWGPAHEYGHMNQGPMCIAGTTEESNNVFSNVSNFFLCKTTSRCDYPSSQLKNFSDGKTYLENGTWGTTRMFWQLWLYYHEVGHNKKFYPRLYELLRRYPLVRETTTYSGKLNGKKDMLQFVKMACLAAEEDLTDFFTSWGFFTPQESYHIDDYSVYDMVLTQEDINEVKAEIKSWNFTPNNAIILIDDRPGSSLATGFGYDKSKCGEYGGVEDFKKGATASGNLEFTVDGNNVKVTGSGNPGLGFLIYDEEGNLIGFSNSNSFTLSTEAAQAMVNGTATVKAVGADNQTVEVVDPVRDGSESRKKELLNSLLQRCDDLLSLSDESYSHVGKIKPEYCTTLQNKASEVKEAMASATPEELTQLYLDLSTDYYALLNDGQARIAVEPGASYRLINHNYTTRALDAGEEKLLSSTYNSSSEYVPFSQQWVMVAAGAEENAPENNTTYHLQNLGNGKFVSTTKKQSAEVPLSDTPQSYTLITIEPGVYSFAPDNENKFGLHIDASNKVVQWNTTSTPTQWSMVKVCSAEQIKLRNELASKISEAENVLATAGTMERTEPQEYVFPESCLYSNAPYEGGGTDGFKSWSVLTDKNVATYFHSNYDSNKDSADGLDHYIRMEEPTGGNFRSLSLSYTTRDIDNTNTNPKTIVIEASADKNKWREVYHASGLPIGRAVTYDTGEILVPADTRYLRFMVTVASSSLVKGHPYFVVSELSVSDLGAPKFTPDAGLPYLTAEDMATLYNEIVDSRLDLGASTTTAVALNSRLTQVSNSLDDIGARMIPEVDVTAVSFAVDPIIMKLGEENLTVTATVEPEDATFPQFEWNIEDESVAIIKSTDGKSVEIEPLSMGTTSLTIRVKGNPLVGATAMVKVLPEIPVEAVVISPAELSVPLNAGSLQLATTIMPENAIVKALKWSSSDASIIEVNEESGELSLLRQGVAEITAVSTDGTDVSGKCVVTVTNPVAEGLILYPTDLAMEPGDQVKVYAAYIPEEAEQPVLVWNTSNEAVADVDPSGLVTAFAPGEATITVTAEVNGKELETAAYVKVNPLSLKSISLTPISVTIEKGGIATLEATVMPEGVEADLVWSSGDTNIATVSTNSGLTAKVTALKPGMTLVTVSSKDKPEITATCHITVPEVAVTEIKLLTTETTLDVKNGSQVLKAAVYPEDAATPRLVWTSSDPNVATVKGSTPLEAVLTPLKSGVTTITVAHGDKEDIYDAKDFTVTSTSGIMGLFEDTTTKIDVFTVAGQIIRKQVDVKDLENMQPGIYIIRQGETTKEILIK